MAMGMDDDDGEIGEINVTPFIDVILILLIVFMVAAPLSTVDVPVSLPGSSAAQGQRPDDPLWLTITADESLVIGETPVAPEDLVTALDARSEGRRDAPVFLRADRSIDYGALMRVLDLLRAAGYLKVALVGLEAVP
jgi:biopolymer transport protein ExbD